MEILGITVIKEEKNKKTTLAGIRTESVTLVVWALEGQDLNMNETIKFSSQKTDHNRL